MSDWELELEGLRNVVESLNDLEAAVETDRTVTVGSGVEYSVYLELGTSDMDPKPFFRPALGELRANGVAGFVREHTRTTVEALGSADQVVAALALALERRIKEIITRKGLIDTGTLRASVLAVPGDNPSALPGEGEFSGFDSDTPAPPRAGRAVASETVSLDI